MSIKEQFSAQEWSTLLSAPMMAGNAVVAADPSGPIGLVKELGALAGTLAKAANESSGNALVQALLAEIKSAAEEGERPELPKPDARDIAGFKQQALEIVAEAVALVDAKVGADVARGYKEFILSMGQKAAEAAKEGGFLGFGGTLVSEDEQAMLSQLKTTLGL
jgi:hypothetical protein